MPIKLRKLSPSSKNNASNFPLCLTQHWEFVKKCMKNSWTFHLHWDKFLVVLHSDLGVWMLVWIKGVFVKWFNKTFYFFVNFIVSTYCHFKYIFLSILVPVKVLYLVKCIILLSQTLILIIAMFTVNKERCEINISIFCSFDMKVYCHVQLFDPHNLCVHQWRDEISVKKIHIHW